MEYRFQDLPESKFEFFYAKNHMKYKRFVVEGADDPEWVSDHVLKWREVLKFVVKNWS